MCKPRILFLLLLSILVWPISFVQAQAQDQEIANEPLPVEFSLFGEEPPLALELTFDYKQFIKRKYKDDYHQAELKVFLRDSSHVADTVRIRARGEFRKGFCQFPPIRLNFKQSNFELSELKKLEKVKLVTTCKYQTVFQQYLFQEYLIYKTYNLLTDKSFRVRLVDITYIDTREKKKPFTQYGFLIEEVEKMAERNECFEIEIDGLSGKACDPYETTLMTVFQYMIGNTDFLINNRHNVKVIRPKDPILQDVFAVPYDFDYSGMVNTIYAIPHPDLGIPSVRNRLYRGYCFQPQVYQKVVAQFLKNKEAIYQLYETFPYFSKQVRRDSIKYLDEFYEIISDPILVKKKFLEECK